MHPYHLGKKPYKAIQSYIRHYTDENELALDPFCGSGGTALAALTLNRKAIAIDASPAATFITRFYLQRTEPGELRRKFEETLFAVGDYMDRLYSSTCHLCNGPARIHYLIYSNYYSCFSCGKPTVLYRPQKSGPVPCEHCGALNHAKALIRSGSKIQDYVPVAVNLSCLNGCRPKRYTRSIFGSREEVRAFRDIDLAGIEGIESEPHPFPYPDQRMMLNESDEQPWGDEWRPGRNFRRVDQLFTTRNLRALAALMDAAKGDADLMAMVSSCIMASSRKAQHLEGGGGYIPGNWALPPVSKQRNVMEIFRRIGARTIKAKEILFQELKGRDAVISTQSATDMSGIPDNSVDYIFTDPPYGGSIQYGELNFIWEAWLGLRLDWRDQEIIINKTRGRSIQDWTLMMDRAVNECFRVLKPGRWMSLCFGGSSIELWCELREIINRAGFEIQDHGKPSTIDTGCGTYNRRVSDKAHRRDITLNFRKPVAIKTHTRGGKRKGAGSPRVHDFIPANPGASQDEIYEHFINGFIRTGDFQLDDFERVISKTRNHINKPKRDSLPENP
jgi:16S rRNA G966 N2-methylase RsmD